jgi:cytochrome c553
MLRWWVLAGLCGLLFATLLRADSGVIKTKDGQTFSGDITIQGDLIIIERKGIKTTISRDEVRTITYSESIEEEYRRRHEHLARYDVRGRIELAQWLFENKSYSLAREVLDEAAQIQPKNPEVQDMIRVVDRQAELVARENRRHAPPEFAAADDKPGARAGAATAAPTTHPTTARAMPLLTPEDVNFVREQEWQAGQPVRATFKNDVRRMYIAREGLDPAVFNRLPIPQQAWAILQNGTPEMRQNVILGDPPAMQQFRIVQRTILASCASCHNAARSPSGNFAIHWPANNDAETYTNFVILQKYNYKSGDRTYSMIDRDHPQDSLLIQFALPSMMASPGHPPAQYYKGIAKSMNDNRMRTVSDWISSLNPVTPDYSSLNVGVGAESRHPRGK